MIYDMSDIIITIDTREKDSKRINSIYSFFEPLNACVIDESLKRCDYQIEGNYREIDINIGIEYKTLNDFSGSYQDLSWKLAESYDYYDDVGLFIELGNYDLIDLEDGSTLFRNYQLKDKEGTLRYDVYQNMLRSFARDGIYIQTFNNIFEFPRSILNLMNYIVKPTHKGIAYKPTDYESIYKNMLKQIPGLGVKRVNTAIEVLPTIYDMGIRAEDHHKEAFGNVLGSRIYNFVRKGVWER